MTPRRIAQSRPARCNACGKPPAKHSSPCTARPRVHSHQRLRDRHSRGLGFARRNGPLRRQHCTSAHRTPDKKCDQSSFVLRLLPIRSPPQSRSLRCMSQRSRTARRVRIRDERPEKHVPARTPSSALDHRPLRREPPTWPHLTSIQPPRVPAQRRYWSWVLFLRLAASTARDQREADRHAQPMCKARRGRVRHRGAARA